MHGLMPHVRSAPLPSTTRLHQTRP
jgi:hypothetical protein